MRLYWRFAKGWRRLICPGFWSVAGDASVRAEGLNFEQLHYAQSVAFFLIQIYDDENVEGAAARRLRAFGGLKTC